MAVWRLTKNGWIYFVNRVANINFVALNFEQMKVKTFFGLGIMTLMAVLLTSNVQAQVRGEVQGFGTGQIRKVHQPVKAPTAPDIVTTEPERNPEWVRVADMMAKYTPRFQYGIRGGVSALKLKNSEEMDGRGLAGGMLAIINSGKYIYQETPRKERQNRVSWNLSAFGRFNFGGGMGNIQLELNYAENRYETAVVNQRWNPDKLISTGTVYDRSLNIPLLIGWKYSIFRMYLGPSFRVYTNFKTHNMGEADFKDEDGVMQRVPVNVANINIDPNDAGKFEDIALQYIKMKHPWFRFACGVSFEFSKVVIDARYTTSFRAAQQEYYSFGNPNPIVYDLTMHNFEFSVGVMF